LPDDPFAGLGLDRTVMMPTPGGRVPPRSASPEQSEPAATSAVTSGLNPLVAAANPLLNIIPQLRASMEHPDPNALRERLAHGIRDFEARARAAGAPTEKVIAARYALCTLIDENAANTPWGASGAWAQHGLLALLHGEVGGGEKFFQLLAKLAENPQANLDVLELMYVCLQFGFEGRYRVIEGGSRQLEAIRQRLLSIIRRQRSEYERDLSGNWRGITTGTRARLGWMPLWVVWAVTILLLLGIYLGFKLSLNRASDTLAGDIAALRVAPPLAPPKPAPVPRLARFLAKEIEEGLVAVDDRADRSIVTLLGDGMFRPGDATVSPQYQTVLARVADELTRNPGKVDVIGHTDNVPIRTLRFSSNWELSKARAESVARLLAVRVDPGRLTIDGLGDTQPIAPNDTPKGQAQNRRVEIVLHVPAEGAPETTVTTPARKP